MSSDPTFIRRVRALEALSDRDFASSVHQWVRGKGGPGDAALWKDPALVERTLSALDTLTVSTEESLRKIDPRGDGSHSKIAYRRELLRLIGAKRREVRPLAHEETERKAQQTRGKGPRHRAYVRLSKLHPEQYLALVREEQARDAQRDATE